MENRRRLPFLFFVGFRSHRDFGAITILLQGGVPGLEFYDDKAKE